ncbi:carboxypeptidase-like regulatory domain-containing protein [Acinetobacter lwoffii]|uniref:Uncharacterized protein n=1 Tax=Acinetobacter lwoffii NIPH 478 TaxID=1217668 RepID=N9HFM3_ACILW|nr:carboxypeptidase-like regulatory domain-containing protein [Acinetobacter lwoffii]ENW30630.1 hypothetical protein F923_01199 [Acinetobacter lwoffii NIPH 478]
MTFTDIDGTHLKRHQYENPKHWYGSPTNTKIPNSEKWILKNLARGTGTIKSGTKFAKDDEGNPVPYAEIFCYLQSDTKLELVSQTVSDVNGLWELTHLNKKFLYTVVARYKGFENTIMSNVYPV